MPRQTKITTPSARRDLDPRREPYWRPIRKGGSVGFRKFGKSESWIARWRTPDGKQKYKSLGDLAGFGPKEQFDEASKRAAEWFEEQPASIMTVSRPTVEMAVKDYIERLRARKGERAVKDAEMRAKAYILPALGKAHLDELTTSKLEKWHTAFVPKDSDPETRRKAQDTANRHLNTLKAVLNHAWRSGLVSNNSAWSRVERFERTRGKRGDEEALSDSQLSRLLENSPESFKTLVVGQLLTGLRPGIEIEHLTREQYSIHDGIATLEVRKSKTGRRVVYLSKEARKFFDELTKDKLPSAPLFTNDKGKPWAEKEASRLMQQIRSKAKLPADTVLYSLRHTYITRALENGANMKLIADNCGTSIKMLEQHYWKSIQRKRQEMLDGVSVLPKAAS